MAATAAGVANAVKVGVRNALKLTMEQIIDAAKPKFVNGHWHKPKLSAMKLAKIRKARLQAGLDWIDPPKPGRNKPEEAKEKKHTHWRFKPPKGHKHERNAEARQKAIEEKMKEMPKLIEEYRKARATAKEPKKGLEFIFPGFSMEEAKRRSRIIKKRLQGKPKKGFPTSAVEE